MAKPRALALMATLLLSSIGVCASADPSMLGMSGGFFLPNAEVLQQQQFSASMNAVFTDSAGSNRVNEWHSLQYGALENLEAGIAYVKQRTRPAEEFLIQAKYQFVPEGARRPAIAAGTVDPFNRLDLKDATVYVVASKQLWTPIDQFSGEAVRPLRGLIGYGSGLYGDGAFAGLEWSLTKNGKVVFEYSRNLALGTNEYLYNLGGQVALRNNLVINAALVDMRDPAIGLSYVIR